MFSNFIYFIIVLLIFSTYQPAESRGITPGTSLVLFSFFLAIFTVITKLLFHRFERKIPLGDQYTLDKKFHKLNLLLSTLAIILLTADIYFLEITALISEIALFRIMPTLQAAFCLLIMMLHLSFIWLFSHSIRKKLYRNEESRTEFIIQNFSFTIPLIIPWFLIAGISDIINILPFTTLKNFIITPVGEVSYLIFIIIALSIFGPVLVQKMWRCKPLEDSSDRRRILSLCEKAGLKINNILSWSVFGGMLITAGVMGIIHRFRYILVTPALLRFLTPEEIDAVVAHEIGHAKKKHMVLYLCFFIGFIFFIGAIFDPLKNAIIYSKPFYLMIVRTGVNQNAAFSAIISTIMITLFFIYFRIIFGYFMRNFERQADTYVYTLMKDAQPLITTFSKIASISGQAPDKPNWHHFSIQQRIDFLEKCEKDRTVIAAHDKKIKGNVFCYMAITLFSAIVYFIHPGETGIKQDSPYYETAIMHQLRTSPDNPELFRLLGDFYYNFKDYKKAEASYNKVLEIDPNDPWTLNNLAWLYATCEDKSLRDPERALTFSLMVTAMEKSPETLDTLAESYYINGNYKEAILIEKKILSLSPKNKSYYEEQLKRFQQAAITPARD